MASTQRVFAFLRLSSPSGLGRVIVCVQLETNRICSWLDTEVRKICKVQSLYFAKLNCPPGLTPYSAPYRPVLLSNSWTASGLTLNWLAPLVSLTIVPSISAILSAWRMPFTLNCIPPL